MSLYEKSIVASGHQMVSRTAVEIIKEGGNAFDAIVAAGFASAVVEPCLTSLGGGGYLIGHEHSSGQNLFFDFFVDTPGLGRTINPEDTHFFPVTVSFSGSDQVFNIGLGSVAVPGTLKGLIHIQKQLGRMSLREVVQPARNFALGHRINEQQGMFLTLIYPIVTQTDRGRDLYEPGGVLKRPGDILENRLCADFLDLVADDQGESFYRGEIAASIDKEMKEGGGWLTRDDLANYQVHERPPLKVPYRDYELLTTSEPSVGGTMIGLSIGLLQKAGPYGGEWGEGKQIMRTVTLMREVEKIRARGVTTPAQLEAFMEDGTVVNGSVEQIRMFSRGTTHISIADKFGNCAAMTFSNGEGSGYFAPGTGVMLNNMMGEDDLHPDGFHSSPPGQRVGSMMSPSLLAKDGEIKLVIGSGGSKRIRTSVSQVLSQIVDFDRPLKTAVEAPRLFWDGEILQVEPGFSEEALEEVQRNVKINLWDTRDVFFGGVHTVIPGQCGAGDSRRGGSVEEV
jgi:gamma-glutamyltranspeptidase / glutathione hydrolase